MESIFADSEILHEKKRAETEARKLMTFERLLGGAGGSGEAYRILQILQSMVRNPNYALASFKGCALCRRPPLSGRGLCAGGYVVLAHLACWVYLLLVVWSFLVLL